MKRKLIAAADLRHANVCAQERGLERGAWQYLNDDLMLLGVRPEDTELIFYATWQEHPNARAIARQALVRGFDVP